MSTTVEAGLPPNEVLREALRDGSVEHPDGRKLKVAANISQANSLVLYRTVLKLRPSLVIEIGMAYGISTLSILSALAENGHGRLISIDPYIGWPTGRLVALHQIERASLTEYHEHMHEPSYSALPKLLGQGVSPDLIYIDGHHNFDYVFTDFFYSDKLLQEGGTVAFNDAGWRSVFKVLRFMRAHRQYDERDVGLPREYRARNPLFSLIKWFEGRSTNDRYFIKRKNWEPGHGFYRSF